MVQKMTGQEIREAIKEEIAPAIQELVFEMMTKEEVKKRMLEIWNSHDFVIELESETDTSRIIKNAS